MKHFCVFIVEIVVRFYYYKKLLKKLTFCSIYYCTGVESGESVFTVLRMERISKIFGGKYFFIYLVGLSLLFAGNLFGGKKKRANYLPLIEKSLSETIEYIFEENYSSADSVCQVLIDEYPGHPAGYFMKGIMYWRQGYFRNDYNKYNDITLSWLKKAEKIAKENIKQNPDDAIAFFFAGGAYGYEGSVYARRKSWLKTGRYAYKGIRSLEKSMQLDSSLYDIYYGSGLYHVLASHQPGAIKWIQKLLPIPTGNSQMGLDYLKVAIEKGTFTNLAAQSALAMAYVYYEKKYQNAIELLNPLVKKYPRNLDFLTTLINAYFYRELSLHTNEWQPIAKRIKQVRLIVKNKGLNFQRWWLHKFNFMEAYMQYMNGHYLIAEAMLSAYCEEYPDKGDSYLTGLAYLTLGKIYDLQGKRERAVESYKKVSKFERMGNEIQLARLFLSSPFSGEANAPFFTGAFVDLPDRP